MNSRRYQKNSLCNRGGFILKGFPSILHFVLRLSVEGRSSGSKDTLKGKEGEVFDGAFLY
jgi:hypothetical protein